eukprot:CAMPEP_0185568114 /NCGR_PEP_ID=MMETSP0434-20130131/1176_1 /TAXON_ID=626734 ORGANISM="Favella taraikaensis, Strain Fe Narragansett Bay" /NCGR_SAMPLE_ID=MMETSP0434 /ASSEMBLY_ACC=CAM_ASM_000379 /LENGTH=70 /DNA_ID=CAMNT_0028182527 /DNA_START=930 /DNA_END=1142 /DNA_ORIENTATION=-
MYTQSQRSDDDSKERDDIDEYVMRKSTGSIGGGESVTSQKNIHNGQIRINDFATLTGKKGTRSQAIRNSF